jgi:hypothetical protein
MVCVLAMDWAVHRVVFPCPGLAGMGLAALFWIGHVLSLPWAGLAWLDWAWPGLAMGWTGDWLGWPCSWPTMGWSIHGLAIGWSGIVCAGHGLD